MEEAQAGGRVRPGWAPDLIGLSVDEALGIARSWDVTLAAIDGSDILRRFGVASTRSPGQAMTWQAENASW